MDYIIIKYILVGDTGVGKSSILSQYTNKKIINYHIPTIGIDYGTNLVNHKNNTYKLQIWDTSGQERYKKLTNTYYRDANCVILVYDITDKNTFNNIPLWITNINKFAVNPVIVLVGNKKDNDADRQVTKDEGISIAKKYNILFMELSTTNYDDINRLFTDTANIYISRNTDNITSDTEKSNRRMCNNLRYECCIFL